MLLADLTPAELVMSEIPSLLKLVSEVHDVLICGPCFGIILLSCPKSEENVEWSVHRASQMEQILDSLVGITIGE